MKTFLIIFINLFLIISFLPAQVPQLINYQGKLDSAGIPLSGTRNLTFNIYNVATAGTTLWTEVQNNITITNGIFNVLLGSVTPFTTGVFGGTGERYLGVTVGAGTEMAPRYRITSTAFSIRAASADGVADNTITSAKIVDGTVAAADLASNSVTTVKIADNNVTAAKIVDEPGVVHYASLPFNSLRSIPSGITSLDSILITIPSPGYIQVFAAFTACISHTNLITDELYFQLMDSRNSISYSNTGFGMIRLPGELPTNLHYWYPIHLSRIFTETTPGTYKYYINARVFSGWDTNDRFYSLQLSAVYYPTAYGTVVPTKQDMTSPEPFESANGFR